MLGEGSLHLGEELLALGWIQRRLLLCEQAVDAGLPLGRRLRLSEVPEW